MSQLGIELSALSAQELRRLLELARARGQDSLVQQLTAELDSRTAAWRAPSIAVTHARRSLPSSAAPDRPARIGAPAMLAALAAAGLAWGLSVPIASEQLAHTRSDEVPPVRLAVALAPDIPSEPTQANNKTDTPPEAEPRSAPLRVARTEPRPARNPCYDEPTPAERLVCGFPALASQHRRMLEAYEAARSAGVDPLVLDGAQAAWRANSANVSDRHVLDDMYETRIRELRADAAAARRDQPSP